MQRLSTKHEDDLFDLVLSYALATRCPVLRQLCTKNAVCTCRTPCPVQNVLIWRIFVPDFAARHTIHPRWVRVPYYPTRLLCHVRLFAIKAHPEVVEDMLK
eukprot:3898328-Rhodomonas_salina.1